MSDPHTSPNDSSEPPQSPVAQRRRAQSGAPLQSEQPNLGMSPASRYNSNLKVLRRRDPSIVSIFDQFSHVCLYHYNGKKWEKQGFEGSMFLYERDSYPPYGFYILNRMGMDDHIQRLYPEDTVGAHSSYLIIRSYPEYTNRRLAIARPSHSHEIPDKFSDVYRISDVPVEEKGEATTIGLWMFATDAREPMIDVMKRLHSYIQLNIPYPEEYRYGPDRPPPPNPHNRSTTISSAPPQSMGSRPNTGPTLTVSPHSHTQGGQGHFTAHHPSQVSTAAPTSGEASELDKLFAKIEPTPVLSAAVAASPVSIPHSTSKMTVESLFAALGGNDLTPSEQKNPSATQLASGSASTGISLLDSIFASASDTSNKATTTNIITQGPRSSAIQLQIQLQTPTIYSPTPSTNILPQVLNQDVISTLLGLPPSRTASAASTAYSSGAHSHPSSREGDNEDESDMSMSHRHGGSDGYSESSTVLDPDAEFDEELQAAGASAGRPLLADSGHQHAGTNGFLGASEHGRVHGDVTPRAPLNGFITPPLVRTNGTRASTQTPGVIEPSSSVSTILGRRPPSRSYSRASNAEPRNHTNGAITSRPLVPFEADSELWPYPRAPVNEQHADSDGDDILELDFGDTSALSDPSAFKRALKNGKKHSRGGSVSDGANGIDAMRDKTKGRKKGKKERAAEQLKIREEIENSWDVPGPSAHVTGRAISNDPPSPSLHPSPSPHPSPEPGHSPHQTPTPHAKLVNGIPSRPQQAGVNGSLIEADTARESIISSLSNHSSISGSLERNEFVREILTLIHTNKPFVDTLFQDYRRRLA
ncbi:hypothetical protein BDZ94DRAFT_1312111 [Collybia nuda]|uniref:Uncharacterized protein n=1 Tax=Collybia nuda TaxID=64659 RepID=A0A9P6CG76_9AGAR|nr:hypothetical protein BDZ94DRAFT_1312111 [Collybia nuda]